MADTAVVWYCGSGQASASWDDGGILVDSEFNGASASRPEPLWFSPLAPYGATDVKTSRFRVDLRDERLWRDDLPLQITNKVFQLLRYFVQNPHRLITKDEILDNLWPGVHVSEGLIKEYVHDLRVALGDHPKRPAFIETVHARGYRFLGGVEVVNSAEITAPLLGPRAIPPFESAVPRIEALPAIAVLPFENLHGDPDDEYLSKGIVEDIIVSLARLRELVVIARDATLSFSGQCPDPEEVGRSLGVHYVLRGSLRRSSRGIAVAVQLLETKRGQALYADRFESPLDGIFDIQDEIIERVVVHVAPTVWKRELQQALRYRPSAYSAFDCTLRAIDIINDLDFNTYAQADEYLDSAMREDPGFAIAFAWAARWRSIKIGQGWSKSPTDDAKDAERLAKRAMELDPQNALAPAVCGHVLSFLFHDYDSALVYLERSRDLSPSNAYAWIVSSATVSYLGRGEEAIRMAERSLRLSPKGSWLFYCYHFLSMAHYVAGNYDDALKWARLSDIENPLFTSNMRSLCLTLSAVGRIEEARAMADRLMALEPDFRLGYYERKRLPYKPPDLRRKVMHHLRLAGLPE